MLADDGEVPVAVPRDCNGTLEPAIVPTGTRRPEGFDAKVLSLYARGLTVREIRSHPEPNLVTSTKSPPTTRTG